MSIMDCPRVGETARGGGLKRWNGRGVDSFASVSIPVQLVLVSATICSTTAGSGFRKLHCNFLQNRAQRNKLGPISTGRLGSLIHSLHEPGYKADSFPTTASASTL